MFWGLIMKPNKCYTKTAKKGSIHVSMAALDISNATDEPTKVVCVFKGIKYLLCTLNKKDKLQCFLDLNFEAGSQVKFTTIGSSHVHLTGYVRVQGVQGGQDKFDKAQKEEEEIEEVQTLSKKDKKCLVKELLEGPPKKKSEVVINSFSEEGDQTSDTDIDKFEEQEDEAGAEEGEDEEEQQEASSLSEKRPKQKKKEQEKISKEKNKKEVKKEQQKQPKKAVPKGGVIVQELKEGTGEPIKSGKFTTVYYTGRLQENNKLFVCTTKGPGFVFRVIKGEIMEGWDTGLVGMKVGGIRRITCPPNIVDVELQEIRKPM